MAIPHVAHVITPFATDGSSIAHVVRALTREHARAGGASTVITSTTRESSFPDALDVAVDYAAVCPREYLSRGERLRDFVRGGVGLRRSNSGALFNPAIDALVRTEPDWVVLHEGEYATTALPLVRRALPAAGVALQAHNPVSRSFLRPELTRLLGAADLILTVSDAAGKELSGRAPAVSGKVRTLHNGVDTALFMPPAQRSAAGPIRLLFVGQVTPHKGVDLVVDALARLGDDAARFTLHVVGSSHHRQGLELSQYERDLRTAATAAAAMVTFEPYLPQSELVRAYQQADCVVIPSRSEPFGMVALEAMASGAVVLASDVGGLPEALGGAGVLIEPDAEAWKAALSAMSRQRIETMRKDAQDRGRRSSWSQVHCRLMDLLAATDTEVEQE